MVVELEMPADLANQNPGEPVRETAPASIAPCADSELLIKAQCYLTDRDKGLRISPDLEAAWTAFYDLYSRKIRSYAFTCGACQEDIEDCVQDVWTELLVRLPAFRLDPARGTFDTWLYHIVRSKTVDLHRGRKHGMLQENPQTMQTVIDSHQSPAPRLEEEELFALAWQKLRDSLSECTLRVLQMRLMEQRPVAEVAEELGLSKEQVWYRYHRARRKMEEIGSAYSGGQATPRSQGDSPHEKKPGKSAQGKAVSSVSRSVRLSSLPHQGGNCVDYVFQRLELGRRELIPEWKVEWICDAFPKPVLHIRKLAIVAYAEICGCEDFINTHWPQIVNAAIAAGVAAGIATIIATPTAALPIFQAEFHKRLQGREDGAGEERIRVSLSARQEANGPWCICKD
jgi:RNA polymerase sigma factor (sigma-70 family)